MILYHIVVKVVIKMTEPVQKTDLFYSAKGTEELKMILDKINAFEAISSNDFMFNTTIQSVTYYKGKIK